MQSPGGADDKTAARAKSPACGLPIELLAVIGMQIDQNRRHSQ